MSTDIFEIGYKIVDDNTINVYKFTPEILDLIKTKYTRVYLYTDMGNNKFKNIIIPDKLPANIKYLELVIYDKPLPELPDNLEELVITSVYFNHPLPESLPNSLINLKLSTSYNYPLPKILPPKLKYLELNGDFNHLLPKLPDTLLSLNVNYNYKHELPELPNSLEKLIVYSKTIKPITKFPSNLKILWLNENYNYPYVNSLPLSLIDLTINNNCYLQELPSNLESLTLHYKFDSPLPLLPITLKHLYLHMQYNHVLPEPLPVHLETLYMGALYSHSLDNLPQGLLKLTVVGQIDMNTIYELKTPLDNLPNTIITLDILCKYNHSLDMLPDSIETLNIIFYDKKINKLPANLKKIIISTTYKYKKDLLILKPDLDIRYH